MAFTEIRFDTIEEFLTLMQSARLTFVLFGDAATSLADLFPLEGDEIGCYVDVGKLNPECFGRFMRNSVVERRADPSVGEIKTIPHVRSFIRGQGFIDTYRDGAKYDLQKFLERSRFEKR